MHNLNGTNQQGLEIVMSLRLSFGREIGVVATIRFELLKHFSSEFVIRHVLTVHFEELNREKQTRKKESENEANKEEA